MKELSIQETKNVKAGVLFFIGFGLRRNGISRGTVS
jgi:hypothetical protein